MTNRTILPCGSQSTDWKVWLLISPLYLSALGLLLLNDFLLKRTCPGFVTGKLSDFAGLFSLGVFLLVCTRKTASLFALALCFVVWKLPLSDTMIQAWNSATGLTIGRTVDPTDLIALVILPLAAFFYRTADAGEVVRRGWCTLSLMVSLFAFTATSRAATPEQQAAFHGAAAEFEFTHNQPNYHLPFGRKNLYQALEAHGFRVSESLAVFPHPGQHSASVSARGPLTLRSSSDEPRLFNASFDLDNVGDGTTLRLTNVSIKKAGRAVSQTDAIRIFESGVISPLR